MQQPYEVQYRDDAVIDLLEIFYWKVFGMKNLDSCKTADQHIFKNEVLSMLEDAILAVKGE